MGQTTAFFAQPSFFLKWGKLGFILFGEDIRGHYNNEISDWRLVYRRGRKLPEGTILGSFGLFFIWCK